MKTLWILLLNISFCTCLAQLQKVDFLANSVHKDKSGKILILRTELVMNTIDLFC